MNLCFAVSLLEAADSQLKASNAHGESVFLSVTSCSSIRVILSPFLVSYL